MPAALHMPAVDTALSTLNNMTGKHSAPTFTAINGRSLLDCTKVRELISWEPGSHLVSQSKSLAEPSPKTSYNKKRPRPEHPQQAVSPREPSRPDCRQMANRHGDQECGSSTLGLSHNNVPPVHKSDPRTNDRSASHDIGADPHSGQKKGGRKRQFVNRTKTGCGTCRRRKKKCDEAKPHCNNCLRGNFECAGYAENPCAKINVAKVLPPLPSQQRMSFAETRAHMVACTVCRIAHHPHCGPSQQPCVEPNAFSKIKTSRDMPAGADL